VFTEGEKDLSEKGFRTLEIDFGVGGAVEKKRNGRHLEKAQPTEREGKPEL